MTEVRSTMSPEQEGQWLTRASSEPLVRTNDPYAPSKAERIRAAIATRWPCGAVPYGTSRKLAAEFGVSPQLVSHQMVKLGYATAEPRVRLGCGECGRKLSGKGPLCQQCKNVKAYLSLTCDQCGKTFQRRTWVRISATSVAAHRGGTYCGRPCFSEYMRTHMREVRTNKHWGKRSNP